MKQIVIAMMVMMLALSSMDIGNRASLVDRYQTNPNNSCGKCPRPTDIEPGEQ